MDPDALAATGWNVVPTRVFSAAIGTCWSRSEAGRHTLGFIAGPEQANDHIGTVHGGALMTFADIALGFGVVHLLGAPHCATAQLQLQFVAAARIGDFVTCEAEVIRQTRQLIFMRGLIRANDRTVASAEGIWKVIEPRPRG